MANTQYQWEGNAPTSCGVAKSVVQIIILRNAIVKYMSIKSIVTIIAVSFSGSQALAKDWTTVNACADGVIKVQEQAACREPIPTTETRPLEFMALFDFDLNGCLPSAGVGVSEEKDKYGKVVLVYKANPGIAIGGELDGSCAYRDQLAKANTMYRKRCKVSDGKEYCARMFALYFAKDQISPGERKGTNGHTNDWEFGLIWTTNNKLTHASYSEHGHVKMKPIEELYKDGKERKTVFINYYCPATGQEAPCWNTHSMRLPDEKEVAERNVQNPQREWVIPNLLDWAKLTHKLTPNLRETFIAHDYGSADMPMTPKNFYSNIKKGLSDGTSMLEKAGYPRELYSELPSSDFEGVWKVVDTAPQVEITLSPLSEATKKGEAKASSGEVGTWEQMKDKDKWAVITWKDTTKIEKTKIAKEDDQYKKSDYRIGERLENEPTTKSVKVLPPERCPAPSGKSICQ